MNDTLQWLRDWAEHRSEEAFSRIVAAHIDFVYSVALRKVAGNSGLAADIAQTVFADLARKASTLRAKGSIAGWLHRHTCLTAATALRAEIRRRAREQTAAAMQAIENSSADLEWSRLSPLLDDAVNALNESDRQAILLRFYERCDLQSVGSILGVGEDAAQKRVTRALDKLRHWLSKEGVTSTTAALAVALGTQSIGAAPIGLASTITSAAVVTTSVSAAGTSALAFLEFMTHTKAKFAVGVAIAAVFATPLVWQEKAIAAIRAENRMLTAQIELRELRPEDQSRSNDRSGVGEAMTGSKRDRTELLRLRDEVASIRARLEEARTARAPVHNEPTSNAMAPGFFSLESARDVGAATGEALFQSFLSAMSIGDTNRLFALGDWSAEGALASADEMLRELPKAVASGELQRDGKDNCFRVVRQVPLEDGDFGLILEMSVANATDNNRMAQRIRRAGNEWRLVMGKHGPSEVKLSEELLRE